MDEFDQLKAALNQPVHEVEPSIVRFMVYLHTFVPEFKSVDVFQHTGMHLIRVFRGVCLEIMSIEKDATFEASALVNPALPNAFSALERVYKIAKGMVKQYGNVRIINAEPCHRPQGDAFVPFLIYYAVTLLL